MLLLYVALSVVKVIDLACCIQGEDQRDILQLRAMDDD